jgi:flagellar M-ring protein FliF
MLTSIQHTWQNLAPAQRAALAGLLVLVFGGILLVARIAGQPSYAVLYSNLEAEDAGAVTARLRELKVDYRLSQGGRAIEVPVDKVYDLRLSLATEGLPRGGSVGFELFDKTSFGATDFTQRMNYQRALAGELARTINRLEGVTESRIHIAMPQPRLYTEREEPVTASVVLHLRPGRQPDDQRIAGIVHLVSSAVEGLKPENVSVLDSQGQLLSSGGGPGALTGNQIELQSSYERRLETQLRRLADQVLGPGKAAIRVSAEMTWDQTETTSETYRPSGLNGRNLPIEEQSSSETYGRRDARGVAGLPGVASNMGVPDPVAGRSGGEGGQYRNSRTDRHYVVNKVVERRIGAPGNIRRLSIAVLLDGQIGVVQQRALRSAFAAAAGLDLTPVSAGGRGDRIELLPIAFDKTAETGMKRTAAREAQSAFRVALARNIAAVAIVLLVLVASLLIARRLRAPEPAVDRSTPGPLDALITGNTTPESPLEALGMQDTPVVEAGEPPPPPSLIEQIRQLASENPSEVARQVQTWMME